MCAHERRTLGSWTVKPVRTWQALRVEPVVAVVRPAGVVGEEPLPARFAHVADYVARGVALVINVPFTIW